MGHTVPRVVTSYLKTEILSTIFEVNPETYQVRRGSKYYDEYTSMWLADGST